jgi:DNA-binding NtrC family response regulator
MKRQAEGMTVLVVDDDADIQRLLVRFLERIGCAVRVAGTIAAARQQLAEASAEVAFVDLHLPDGLGSELVKWAVATSRVGRAFCITGHATTEDVVQLMRAGCLDVLAKPFDMAHLRSLLEVGDAAAEDLAGWRRRHAPNLVGEDPRMLSVLETIQAVADTPCTVLVTGETGTGKEVAARVLHDASPRRDQPFVALNCAAIPESLIEAELFGHTRGAFTGAVVQREGRILAAHGGTLFLDEIGDMPLSAQAKLLRVLQERTVTPIGSDRALPADVRVVAATNKDLEAMVAEGSFRADLYYRLSVVRVELPALRERPSDILPLARRFLALANEAIGRRVDGFDTSAEAVLRNHPWPGNVRELANAIERAVVLKRSGGLLNAQDVVPIKPARGTGPVRVPAAPAASPSPAPAAPTESSAPSAQGGLNLKDAIENLELQLIRRALEQTNGNRTEAAVLLGLNRTTLVEKLRKYAI